MPQKQVNPRRKSVLFYTLNSPENRECCGSFSKSLLKNDSPAAFPLRCDKFDSLDQLINVLADGDPPKPVDLSSGRRHSTNSTNRPKRSPQTTSIRSSPSPTSRPMAVRFQAFGQNSGDDNHDDFDKLCNGKPVVFGSDAELPDNDHRIHSAGSGASTSPRSKCQSIICAHGSEHPTVATTTAASNPPPLRQGSRGSASRRRRYSSTCGRHGSCSSPPWGWDGSSLLYASVGSTSSAVSSQWGLLQDTPSPLQQTQLREDYHSIGNEECWSECCSEPFQELSPAPLRSLESGFGPGDVLKRQSPIGVNGADSMLPMYSPPERRIRTLIAAVFPSGEDFDPITEEEFDTVLHQLRQEAKRRHLNDDAVLKEALLRIIGPGLMDSIFNNNIDCQWHQLDFENLVDVLARGRWGTSTFVTMYDPCTATGGRRNSLLAGGHQVSEVSFEDSSLVRDGRTAPAVRRRRMAVNQHSHLDAILPPERPQQSNKTHNDPILTPRMYCDLSPQHQRPVLPPASDEPWVYALEAKILKSSCDVLSSLLTPNSEEAERELKDFMLQIKFYIRLCARWNLTNNVLSVSQLKDCLECKLPWELRRYLRNETSTPDMALMLEDPFRPHGTGYLSTESQTPDSRSQLGTLWTQSTDVDEWLSLIMGARHAYLLSRECGCSVPESLLDSDVESHLLCATSVPPLRPSTQRRKVPHFIMDGSQYSLTRRAAAPSQRPASPIEKDWACLQQLFESPNDSLFTASLEQRHFDCGNDDATGETNHFSFSSVQANATPRHKTDKGKLMLDTDPRIDKCVDQTLPLSSYKKCCRATSMPRPAFNAPSVRKTASNKEVTFCTRRSSVQKDVKLREGAHRYNDYLLDDRKALRIAEMEKKRFERALSREWARRLAYPHEKAIPSSGDS
eukprot:Blabericola_migrator_1__7825@NODE_3_length_32604_cov_133_371700_g2_i0_p6_GENE_NODE_3_length_32604_cov_133_371700_g2_i0NODE_3_length_32604_cov_133_371700_g2_i0_p6_ORF_typecomplete_len904_score118_45_NODE_3_length_32604_cov_133_371700_g2_i02852631237